MHGVSLGNFPRFIFSRRGIEANLEKIKVVLEMQVPQSMKQLQQLTWENSRFKSVYFKIHQQVPSIFQNFEEGFLFFIF